MPTARLGSPNTPALVRSCPPTQQRSRTLPMLSMALSLAAGCARASAVWVPQLDVSASAIFAHSDASQSSRGRAEVVLGLWATFQPRPLRVVLPSVFDISPDLAATPCEEDDTTCLSEALPDDAAAQRWLAELQ